MDPKDKVAMLTGGARIGQVVAHSLALHGCNLALIYRGSRDAAEASAQAAIREGVRAITIRANAATVGEILPLAARSQINAKEAQSRRKPSDNPSFFLASRRDNTEP
jgi:NAD(P)-dependent dehydrogenase (short-subunit alcohol dehydrogenase family)